MQHFHTHKRTNERQKKKKSTRERGGGTKKNEEKQRNCIKGKKATFQEENELPFSTSYFHCGRRTRGVERRTEEGISILLTIQSSKPSSFLLLPSVVSFGVVSQREKRSWRHLRKGEKQLLLFPPWPCTCLSLSHDMEMKQIDFLSLSVSFFLEAAGCCCCHDELFSILSSFPIFGWFMILKRSSCFISFVVVFFFSSMSFKGRKRTFFVLNRGQKQMSICHTGGGGEGKKDRRRKGNEFLYRKRTRGRSFFPPFLQRQLVGKKVLFTVHKSLSAIGAKRRRKVQ